MPTDFQSAYRRARQLFHEDAWLLLSPHERAEAIYKELRAIDMDRAVQKGAQMLASEGAIITPQAPAVGSFEESGPVPVAPTG